MEFVCVNFKLASKLLFCNPANLLRKVSIKRRQRAKNKKLSKYIFSRSRTTSTKIKFDFLEKQAAVGRSVGSLQKLVAFNREKSMFGFELKFENQTTYLHGGYVSNSTYQGQWLWNRRHCDCFQYRRTRDQVQSLAVFLNIKFV